MGYENANTKLEKFKVSKKDANSLKMGKQMSRKISGKRRADDSDGAAEDEEGEGTPKGKRTRRLTEWQVMRNCPFFIMLSRPYNRKVLFDTSLV